MDAALPCAGCEYDLRTLDPVGVCPECATPIAASIVAASDPLRGVRRRLRAAALVLVVASGTRLAFAVALAAYHLSRGNPRFTPYALSLVLNLWPLNEVLSLLIDGMSRGNLIVQFLCMWFVL